MALSSLETELAGTLRDTLMCLTEHLSQESHDMNVHIDTLCPCNADQGEKARELLCRVDSLR